MLTPSRASARPAASAWRDPWSVKGRSSSGRPSAASACRSNQSMLELYEHSCALPNAPATRLCRGSAPRIRSYGCGSAPTICSTLSRRSTARRDSPQRSSASAITSKVLGQLVVCSAQVRSLTRSPGCSVAGFSRGFSCSSFARLTPVAAAMEPSDWPGRTIQKRGPGGLGRGFGGCADSFKRSPGRSLCGSMLGFRSSRADRP